MDSCNLCRILLVLLTSRDVELARKTAISGGQGLLVLALALKFRTRTRVGFAVKATRPFEMPYTVMQTIDISSGGILVFNCRIIYAADGATYSLVTAVLALSLWYTHLSGRFWRFLQVPHTGITPSHLILRALHASQARATLRRRRGSFCRCASSCRRSPLPV